MGVCLSCHGRKRRSSEKKKSDLQLCQSLAPLHECVDECDKVVPVQSPIAAAAAEPGDADPLHRASVAAAQPRRDSADPTASNGTTKRSVSAIKDNLRIFNKFSIHCNSTRKQSLTIPNGHHSAYASNKKDNSCNSKCDSFSTDLINGNQSSQEDSATMANIFSTMFSDRIRVTVSKNRTRYVAPGFNLDLTYITENIIAMGFPATNIEGIYRNKIDDVAKLLDSKHKDHYKVYNLCSEKKYDISKFHYRVTEYAFDDHNPPKIDLIRSFCEDVYEWLSNNPLNVAVVHCKAGKGRTGTMICCYLLHSHQCATAEDALNLYGQQRTRDTKGVTIPSQRRYVEYYAALLGMLRREMERGSDLNQPMDLYQPPKLRVMEVLISPRPNINGGHCTLEFIISEAQHSDQKLSLGCFELRKDCTEISLRPKVFTAISGDIKVEVRNKTKNEKLFHLWFNTFFVTRQVNAVAENEYNHEGTMLTAYRLSLDKSQIDVSNKEKRDKIYCSKFKVEILVLQVPESYPPHTAAWTDSQSMHNSAPGLSNSSTEESEDSMEQEENWDSGERRRGSMFPVPSPTAHMAPRRRLSTPLLNPASHHHSYF